MASQRIPLADAGLRTGQTYHQIRNLLLSGEVRGGRDAFGRLFVHLDDLKRWAEDRGEVLRPRRK